MQLVIVDTLAKVLVVWIISKSFELILNFIGEMARFDHGINDLFGSEFRIKVGHIQHGLDGWLERWLNLLGYKARKNNINKHCSPEEHVMRTGSSQHVARRMGVA